MSVDLTALGEIEYGTVKWLSKDRQHGKIQVTSESKPIGPVLDFELDHRRRLCPHGLSGMLIWMPVDRSFEQIELGINSRIAFRRHWRQKKIGFWAVHPDYIHAVTTVSADHYLIIDCSIEAAPAIMWEGLYKENSRWRIDHMGVLPKELDGCVIYYEDFGDYKVVEDQIQRFALLRGSKILKPDQQRTTTGRRAM